MSTHLIAGATPSTHLPHLRPSCPVPRLDAFGSGTTVQQTSHFSCLTRRWRLRSTVVAIYPYSMSDVASPAVYDIVAAVGQLPHCTVWQARQRARTGLSMTYVCGCAVAAEHAGEGNASVVRTEMNFDERRVRPQDAYGVLPRPA